MHSHYLFKKCALTVQCSSFEFLHILFIHCMKLILFMPQLKIKPTIPLHWKWELFHITFVELLRMMLEHLTNSVSIQKQSSGFDKYNFYCTSSG